MKGFAIYNFKFGKLNIGYEDIYITHIKIEKQAVVDLGVKTEISDKAYNQLLEYIEGKRKTFNLDYQFNGTDFQNKVWKALCDIPYGETRSYKDIAIAIDNEKASRAVGMANNKNPIGIVVPCHRVIGSNGKLVGYASGLEMKEALLKLEKENI